MNRTTLELIVVICFLITALLLLNPFGVPMDSAISFIALGGFSAFAILFSAIVVRDIEGDEREHVHRASAGKAAFTVGTLMLLAGIFYQTSFSVLDPWLVYTLSSMVLAKLIVRVYCAYRN